MVSQNYIGGLQPDLCRHHIFIQQIIINRIDRNIAICFNGFLIIKIGNKIESSAHVRHMVS